MKLEPRVTVNKLVLHTRSVQIMKSVCTMDIYFVHTPQFHRHGTTSLPQLMSRYYCTSATFKSFKFNVIIL